MESKAARRRRLERVMTVGPARLIIVCHGNIMRSAFAVAYLRQLAPDRAVRIVGAGTHASRDRPAQDSALLVAREFGVSLDSHRSVPFETVTIGAGDVIVCMDRANEANVIARYPQHKAWVFLIGDRVSGVMIEDRAERFIVDPYNRGDDATRMAFRRILAHAPRWLSLLK
jgi:protein-tyrosine-phosphatase